jgi:hypothetical protein
MTSFSFTGTYRVENNRDATPSMLCGRWSSTDDALDHGIVDAALRAHPQWRGEARLALRPALVTTRSGELASAPDVLYERERFTPNPGTPPLPADVLDVRKAVAQWKIRVPHVAAVLSGRTHTAITERLHDLDTVISNWTHVHEAGHLVGYDVRRKHADGYFSASGRTAWPLVYLEELRADLHGFGFAVALLPPEQAVQILLYELALHFGVHREGLLTRGVAPHGIVPFLLFSLLRELGAIVVTEGGGAPTFRLVTLDTPWLYRVMLMCADHAQTRLTAPELAAADPLRRALGAARYVRERLCDGLAVEAYSRVMQPIPVPEHHFGPRVTRIASRAANSA